MLHLYEGPLQRCLLWSERLVNQFGEAPPEVLTLGTALALRASGASALLARAGHAERALWGSGVVDAASLPVAGRPVPPPPSPLQGGLQYVKTAWHTALIWSSRPDSSCARLA